MIDQAVGKRPAFAAYDPSCEVSERSNGGRADSKSLIPRGLLASGSLDAYIDWDLRVVQVDLTKQRVKESPSIDTNKPVSRQHEMEFSGYYGYLRRYARSVSNE